jgi:nitroimidazol reductase NimA-like FMN-containing flavoprotein (pyridoxamine 5'-phosphate oxidase superfamily)
MPSRRQAIDMTQQELSEYLAEQRRIILITNGANGLPHPMPMNYGIDAESRVVIATFRKSQKVKNLERDPRATLRWKAANTIRNSNLPSSIATPRSLTMLMGSLPIWR